MVVVTQFNGLSVASILKEIEELCQSERSRRLTQYVFVRLRSPRHLKMLQSKYAYRLT